jgi:ABC-2 type transport system permease protein
MITALRKYGFIFTIGLQNGLVYRWNFFIRASFSLIHLVFIFTFWNAAYRGMTQLGGFDVRQTMTYFVVVFALQFIVGAFNEDFQIGEEIRNGLINQFLLKPINYYAYRVSQFLAARTVSGALVFLPLVIISPLLLDYLVVPHGLWRLPLGLVAMALAAVLQFTIAFCFGLLAFWFLEIQGFVILSYSMETFLSGTIFPLDLLPAWAAPIAQRLPFAYQMYFPAAILSGRLNDPAAALQGLAIQAGWVLVAVLFARLLWARGLRHHTAVGG